MLFVNLNQRMCAHQVALADELYKILGDKFVFVEFGSQKINQYGSYDNSDGGIDYYKNRPYILNMHSSLKNEKKAKELIEMADVMRTGGEPLDLTTERIKAGKLTFRSTERLFKKPVWQNPRYLQWLFNQYIRLCNKNYRVLCQSAFVPNDLAYCPGNYKEKCYKFAYFTQIPELNWEVVNNVRKRDRIIIVWCARFIDWKHPELPVLLAERLIQSGRKSFEIQMIGADTTPMWKEIKNMVDSKNLNNYITLTGGVPNIEVKRRMRDSNIFIFTSDRGEGWGAVLNEAMGSGCACVASNEIGAVPYLLTNNKNGYVYKSCSVNSLYEKVSILYDNPELREKFGREAYQTITGAWSAHLAAERLVRLSESILSGNEISFDDGPCAKAKLVYSQTLL